MKSSPESPTKPGTTTPIKVNCRCLPNSPYSCRLVRSVGKHYAPSTSSDRSTQQEYGSNRRMEQGMSFRRKVLSDSPDSSSTSRAADNAAVKNEDINAPISEASYLVTENNALDWPLPVGCKEGEGDATTGCVTDPTMWDLESWQELCHGRKMTECIYNIWASKDFSIYLDTKFEVGPEKVLISGHRLIFSLFCESDIFRRRSKDVIKFPQLDHLAFSTALKYIYTKVLEFASLSHGIKVLKVANTLGIRKLQAKCTSFLQSKIDCDTVVEIFCSTLETESEDGRLKELAALYITRNIREVLASNGFLALSEENVHRFLQNDDWYIEDELQVFNSVIRWATNKIAIRDRDHLQGKKVNGSDLREMIGRALYEIRFMSLDNVGKFLCKISSPYGGLFTEKECLAIGTCIAASNDRDREGDPPVPPPNFNPNPRIRKLISHSPTPTIQHIVAENTLPTPTTPTNQEVVTENTFISDDDGIMNTFDSVDDPKLENENTNGEVRIPECSVYDDANDAASMVQTDEENLNSPPPKKWRSRSSAETNDVPFPSAIIYPPPSPPLATVTVSKDISLHDYVKLLRSRVDSETIEKIDKEIKIPTIPSLRVYLPNLKEFNLTLIPNNYSNFESGSALKGYIKPKLAHLSDILFFDTKTRNAEPEVSAETAVKSKTILSELLRLKVNVTVTCSNTVFLRINHDEGVILMNLIKDAQEVLNGARDFPLKVLAVSECELESIDQVERNLLEEIDLTEDLLNGNPYLEKLSLAKCQLTFTVLGSLTEHQNFLRQLYLDNCCFTLDVMYALPKLFPYVKRVQVYGKTCDAPLLYNILLMESIEWVFVCELNYTRIKSGKKQKGSVLTEESAKIQEFLTPIFDADFAKKEKITFILEKKKELFKSTPGTSISALQETARDPFNSSCWEGKKITKQPERFETVSRLDFKNFSYDMFFSSYGNFCFFESTEKDAKKKKKKTNSSNDNNQTLNPQLMDITEPVSNKSATSTDEVIDIMDCY